MRCDAVLPSKGMEGEARSEAARAVRARDARLCRLCAAAAAAAGRLPRKLGAAHGE
jgi:hypothetical protein